MVFLSKHNNTKDLDDSIVCSKDKSENVDLDEMEMIKQKHPNLHYNKS